MIIDTHVHASPYWYEPIETILDQMNRNDVDKVVLIQFRGQFDNDYLIECVRRFPGRFSATVVVDTRREDAPQALERVAAQGAEGVRIGPSVRSLGLDPLAIWRKAEELGLVVSCGLGNADDYASPEFEEIIKAVPNLPIIIEHLGFIRTDSKPPHSTYKRILGLSQYPNTYMKFHGLGENNARPDPFIQPFPWPNLAPYIEMAYDAFGATRMMWGSDFPPVAGREGYRNSLRLPMEHVKWRSDEDREWAFGKTAANLWKFAS